MKKSLVAAALAGLTMIGPSCSIIDNYLNESREKYEESHLNNLKKAEEDIRDNFVYLETETHYTSNSGYPGTNVIQGEGLVYDDYILTVDHIVSYNQKTLRSSFGTMTEEIEKQGEKSWILDEDKKKVSELEVILNDDDRDIAIMKLPEELKGRYGDVKIGDAYELERFDKVYIIGNTYDDNITVRSGIIGNDNILNFKKSGEDRTTAGLAADFESLGGDSGNPIINEDGEVIGFLAATDGARNVIKPINWYLEEIEKYENGINRNRD